MVKIIWTEIALDDLRLIHEYICKDSKVYADRFIDKLFNRVDQLENFPKSGFDLIPTLLQRRRNWKIVAKHH